MVKKLKLWLNNKLNKYLHCTVGIKFLRIFVTELVFTFFVFRYKNHFEFPKEGIKAKSLFKNSGKGKGDGGHQRPPGTESREGWWGCKSKSLPGGMDIFWNHTMRTIASVW